MCNPSNRPHLTAAASLAFFLLAGCESPRPPEGTTCQTITSPSSSRGLRAALESAAPGDCVVLGTHTFVGSFRLPAGVQLLAGATHAPKIIGEDARLAALEVEGGENTRVQGLEIDHTRAGVALDLRDGPAQLLALTLRAPDGIGLFVGCPTEGCVGGPVELRESRIIDSEMGLWLDGAVVVRSASNTFEDASGSGVIEGYGVTVTGGARLESTGDRIAKNGGLGLLVDGADTTASLLDLVAVDNGGAGIWLQGLRGTSASPAFTLEGAASTLAGNTKAGLGAVDVVGIIMGTCIVHDTRASPWPLPSGDIAQIADGIALLGQSAEVLIGADVTLSDNARAQILIDQGGAGLVVDTATVAPGRGRYGVVVQNTSAGVSLTSGVVADTPASLGVDDAPQATP